MRPAWLVLTVAAAVLSAAGVGARAVYAEKATRAAAAAASCTAPPALAGVGPFLGRVAAHLKPGATLTIVALGSSSTSGVGASAPQLSYPSRLEADLRALLPATAVRVINRGKGGDEVPQMLARFDRDVLLEHPDLVIWQLGTNAVLHHADPADEAPLIARGIARLQRHDIDVVLMDLQYAPRVVAMPAYRAMEGVIAAAAKRAHVGVFRRFAIMQAWQAEHPGEPSMTIWRDGLHMNDRGYGCVAADLAEAIAANARPSLHAPQGRDAGTVAGFGGSDDRFPFAAAAAAAAVP
jgi:acyl-CoA thioesterase I